MADFREGGTKRPPIRKQPLKSPSWIGLKNKKGVSIVDAFQKVIDKSGRKPNKIWVEKGSEFYNSSVKKSLIDNDIEMYLIDNEGKSAVAEIFIRTLKNKTYKYITALSKNVYTW